ncbi:hypothetical protein BKA93DRAFT_931660, partial [Sparassis latifolia]
MSNLSSLDSEPTPQAAPPEPMRLFLVNPMETINKLSKSHGNGAIFALPNFRPDFPAYHPPRPLAVAVIESDMRAVEKLQFFNAMDLTRICSAVACSNLANQVQSIIKVRKAVMLGCTQGILSGRALIEGNSGRSDEKCQLARSSMLASEVARMSLMARHPCWMCTACGRCVSVIGICSELEQPGALNPSTSQSM